jgi:hypothetical protein
LQIDSKDGAGVITHTKQALDNAMSAIERIGIVPNLTPDGEDHAYTPDQTNMDKACETAFKKGMALHFGDRNSLLIDLDRGAALNLVVLKKLVENFGDYTMASWISKSGNGEHVVLRFENADWTHAEAIALEAALGSDPIRAVLSILRVKLKVNNPRVLFKPRSPFDPPVL